MIDKDTQPNIPAVWELTAAILAENQKSVNGRVGTMFHAMTPEGRAKFEARFAKEQRAHRIAMYHRILNQIAERPNDPSYEPGYWQDAAAEMRAKYPGIETWELDAEDRAALR